MNLKLLKNEKKNHFEILKFVIQHIDYRRLNFKSYFIMYYLAKYYKLIALFA